MRFGGILNSTTNLIMTEMEHGNRFEAAVKKASDLLIAETESSFDVDGWGTTVKVSALATVLTLAMRVSANVYYVLKPQDIKRKGIRGLNVEQVQAAKATRTCAPVQVWESVASCHAGSPRQCKVN